MVEREGVLECRAGPVRRRVAARAVRAELALVLDRLGMAADARLRRTDVYVGDVARLAIDRPVLACQLENGQVVVERRAAPRARRVTFSAVRAEAALVHGRLRVTADTGPRRAGIDIIDVARLAVDRTMLARQLERGQIVVEHRAAPSGR